MWYIFRDSTGKLDSFGLVLPGSLSFLLVVTGLAHTHIQINRKAAKEACLRFAFSEPNGRMSRGLVSRPPRGKRASAKVTQLRAAVIIAVVNCQKPTVRQCDRR